MMSTNRPNGHLPFSTNPMSFGPMAHNDVHNEQGKFTTGDPGRTLNIPHAHIPRKSSKRFNNTFPHTQPVSCVQHRQPVLNKDLGQPKTAVSPNFCAESLQPLDLTVKRECISSIKNEPCEPEGANHAVDEPIDLSIHPKPLDLSKKICSLPLNIMPIKKEEPANSHPHEKYTPPSVSPQALIPSVVMVEESNDICTPPKDKQKKKKRKRKKASMSGTPSKQDANCKRMAILLDSNGEEIYRMSSQSLVNIPVLVSPKPEKSIASPAPSPSQAITHSKSSTPVIFKSLLTGAIITQRNPASQTAKSPEPEMSSADEKDSKNSKRNSLCDRSGSQSPIQETHQSKPIHEPIDDISENNPNSSRLEILGVIKPGELLDITHSVVTEPENAQGVAVKTDTGKHMEKTLHKYDSVEPNNGVKSGDELSVRCEHKRKDRRKPRKNHKPKSTKLLDMCDSHSAEDDQVSVSKVSRDSEVDLCDVELESDTTKRPDKSPVIKSMLEHTDSPNHSDTECLQNNGSNTSKICEEEVGTVCSPKRKASGFSSSKLFSLLTGNMSSNAHVVEDSSKSTGLVKADEDLPDQCSNEDQISTKGATLSDAQDNDSDDAQITAESNPDTEEDSETKNTSSTPSVEERSPKQSHTCYRSLLSGKVVEQNDITDGVMVVARGVVCGEKNSRYELVVDFKPEHKSETSPKCTSDKKVAQKPKPRKNKLEQICRNLWQKSKETVT